MSKEGALHWFTVSGHHIGICLCSGRRCITILNRHITILNRHYEHRSCSVCQCSTVFESHRNYFILLIKLNCLCNENNCLDLNAIFTTHNPFFSSGKALPLTFVLHFFKGQGHQGIFLLGRGQSKEIVNFFWSISRTPIRPGAFLQLQNNTQYYIVGYSVVILQVSPHCLHLLSIINCPCDSNSIDLSQATSQRTECFRANALSNLSTDVVYCSEGISCIASRGVYHLVCLT